LPESIELASSIEERKENCQGFSAATEYLWPHLFNKYLYHEKPDSSSSFD